MTAGTIKDGPQTLYRMRHSNNSPAVGDEYVALHIENSEDGFDLCEARGTVKSLQPLQHDQKVERYKFSTRAEASAEFTRRVDIAHREGFKG